MTARVIVDEAGLEELAARLADWLRPPVVVYLEGGLGAGKTTLARALLRAFGHAGPVRSPSYTLVESYAFADCEIHHLDLYRLADPAEADFLGLADLESARAIWLIEWPERGAGHVPPPNVRIRLAFAGERRAVSGLPEEIAT